MATSTTLISSVTVGAGGAASMSFSSIPSTYTDLVMVVSGRSAGAFTRRTINLTINGSSTTTDYADKYLLGSGSAASSGQDTSGSQGYLTVWDAPAASATANVFSNCSIYIPNYASTSTYKSVSVDGVGEDNATAAYAGLTAGIYQQNTAITSIAVATQGNFVQYSTAYLYGIKNS
jgi:hypothetical protein